MNKPSNIQQVLSNKGDAIDESARQSDDLIEEVDESVVAQATREERIRVAAYAAAERRGFEPGFEIEDWLEAERQIDAETDAA